MSNFSFSRVSLLARVLKFAQFSIHQIFFGLSSLRHERDHHHCSVAQSMVSANHWLGGIKTYRLSWYLTRVSYSANHASSNWVHGNKQQADSETVNEDSEDHIHDKHADAGVEDKEDGVHNYHCARLSFGLLTF